MLTKLKKLMNIYYIYCYKLLLYNCYSFPMFYNLNVLFPNYVINHYNFLQFSFLLILLSKHFFSIQHDI